MKLFISPKLFVTFLLMFLFACASTTLEQKYAKTSTAELKLRHAQCVDFLSSQKNAIIVKFSPGDGRRDRIREKEEIEKELLRRYQTGDKGAYLPIFQ